MVSPVYHPFERLGGPAFKVKAIAERLVSRDHEVTVVTSSRRGVAPGERVVEGVGVHYLASFGCYRAVTINPGIIPFCISELTSFDVIHIFGMYDVFGPIVSAFCRQRRLPYVVEPQGMHRPIVRSIRKKRLYQAFFGNGVIRGAAGVVATSQYEQEQLVGDGVSGDKIMVRRNAIDFDQFASLPPLGRFRSRWGIPRDTALVLFLGRLAEKKRPLTLLHAFAALPTTTGTLVFAGPDEGEHQRVLEAEAAWRGLTGRVIFTGPLFGADKLEALVDADVFVLPSVNENFGNTVVEAMACGTAVVVTDQCGVAPFVEGRAGLVVPAQTASLREGLSRLLEDGTLRTRFGAEGRQIARKLTWDEPVSLLEHLYEKVSDEHRIERAMSPR